MRTKCALVSLCTFLCVLYVSVLLVGTGSVQAAITSGGVIPSSPTCADSVVLFAGGYFPDACWSLAGFEVERVGNNFYFNLYGVDVWKPEMACAQVIIDYTARECVGILEPGIYKIHFNEYHHSLRDSLPEYRLFVFSVMPPVGLPLHSGWQWISTNVDPYPCKMQSIFGDCWSVLDIVKAPDGSFCKPGVGCWIDCWEVCQMYVVHMAEECTIGVCGTKVPTDKPCPLPVGWNCIAYFPKCPLEPETALVSIWDNLSLVKNDDGEFCIPGVGCWIECMEPNEGYKVHLVNADTLIYPFRCPPCPPPFAKRNSFPGFAQTTHFNYSGNTGESYSIVVNSVERNEKQAEVGDEIGVFTSSGLCVGAGVWQGDILGIASWQDDDRADVVNGFQVGEEMIFKLWDKKENKEVILSASFEKGDGRLGTGDYALVNLKGVSSPLPEKFELAQNYPNPFNPGTIIEFSIPQPTHAKLEILNLLGQKVITLVDDQRQPGNYQLRWDGTNSQGNAVANGIYFYRLVTNERIIVRKMLLVK